MAHRLNDARIYVGNLPPDIRNKDIEDIFYKYGRILNVDLKNKKGPPFAFVEFEDTRDAQDAVHAKDGYNYDGYRLRVEFPRGTANGPSRPNHSSSYRGGDSSYSNGRGGRNNNGSGGKRTDYRVIISGLPPSGSWQDLKDHMREAGDVVYADVFKDGTGVVEFMKYDDMKYALRKLDDSKFTSHEGEATYIRVKEDGDHGKRRSSRRSPRSHSRGNSRGNSRGRNTRASPSYSPARKSRSRSRSSRSRS